MKIVLIVKEVFQEYLNVIVVFKDTYQWDLMENVVQFNNGLIKQLINVKRKMKEMNVNNKLKMELVLLVCLVFICLHQEYVVQLVQVISWIALMVGDFVNILKMDVLLIL